MITSDFPDLTDVPLDQVPADLDQIPITTIPAAAFSSAI